MHQPAARPSLAAACAAWCDHISDLLDQHRMAHEIDDHALYEFVLQFIAARDACSPGGYEIGLRMYDAISLRRVQGVLKERKDVRPEESESPVRDCLQAAPIAGTRPPTPSRKVPVSEGGSFTGRTGLFHIGSSANCAVHYCQAKSYRRANSIRFGRGPGRPVA